MAQYLLWALAFSLFINIVLFIIAYVRQTDKLTDISYALTFIALGAVGFLQLPLTPYRIALGAMVGLWAVRLGGFLLLRIWVTKKDSRFDALRRSFWKFGRFWIGQAVAAWVILLPVLLVLRHPYVQLSWVGLVGISLWIAGLALETVADFQKFVFSLHAQHHNQWIDSGVWRYSRHPNYFGEIVLWIGIFIYCSAGIGQLELLVGALGPLGITALLLFVSGLPPLEKKADQRWGSRPAYKKYKRTTSILIPLPKHRP